MTRGNNYGSRDARMKKETVRAHVGLERPECEDEVVGGPKPDVCRSKGGCVQELKDLLDDTRVLHESIVNARSRLLSDIAIKDCPREQLDESVGDIPTMLEEMRYLNYQMKQEVTLILRAV